MHSLIFPGTFSSNYLMYICVGKLENIYFNMNNSEHFGKCNFPFLYLRQGSYLFIYFCLQKHYSVSQGLGAQSAVTLLAIKCKFSLFSWYFFFKNLTYIYVGTYTKYLFQYKASVPFDNLFFKIGLVCRYIKPGV